VASKTVTVRNDVGLHARPAAVFAKAAMRYAADVQVEKAGTKASAKSLLSVLKLDVQQGDEITISAEGHDAQQAVDELADLVEGL
jgi:phosphocarrier protein HPr